MTVKNEYILSQVFWDLPIYNPSNWEDGTEVPSI